SGIVPTAAPTVIVSGLPLTGDHPMHPFAIDARGALYVNSGSATNACQVQNRMPNSPGYRPCTELETRAGIWRYEAERTGQRFSPAERGADFGWPECYFDDTQQKLVLAPEYG